MKNVKKILAPTDLSKLSRVSVRKAMELGAESGAEVIVYHVVDVADDQVLLQPKLSKPARLVPHRQQLLREFIRDCCAEFVGKAKHREVVEAGTPIRRILQRADREAIDLIVISTHGRTGLDRYMVGSVTEKVVARSPCPVLSIHPREKRRA